MISSSTSSPQDFGNASPAGLQRRLWPQGTRLEGRPIDAALKFIVRRKKRFEREGELARSMTIKVGEAFLRLIEAGEMADRFLSEKCNWS